MLCCSPKMTHSPVVRVLKMAVSSSRSSRSPRAWSAYWLPGWASNSSGRPMPSQKFFQNSRSLAMKMHVAVGRLVDLVAHAALHAGGARRPALVVVALVAGDLGLGPLVGLVGLAAEPVHGGRGVALGDLHAAALAGVAGPDDAGQHAQRTEQRAGVDAHRRVLGDVGEAVLVERRVHQAGPRVVGDAVARQVLVGAGGAVAGDPAEHDAGVDLAQLLVAEAAALERAGAHALDHGVALAGQLEERGHALGALEVEHEAALAAADVQVHQRHALDDRPRHLADVVTRRRLDLDDVGAEVGQRGGDGARPEDGHLEDADAGERRSWGERLRRSSWPHLTPHQISPQTARDRCRRSGERSVC